MGGDVDLPIYLHKMHKKKEDLLEALERSLGIVSTACKAADVSRRSHYNWMEEDEEYRKRVNEINDSVLDFAESHLYKLVKEGNPAATIFFLKTKGKARGYVERQEVEIHPHQPLSWFKE